MNKKGIILIGAGGHCISCIDVIEQTNKYEIVGVLDLPAKVGAKVLNYPVIGTDDDIQRLCKQCPDFLITVGQIKTSEIRENLFDKVISAGGKLPVIISPLAYVSKYSMIGEGTIVMHQAFVNAGAEIGKGCIINSKALIEHEAKVGDFCHISTASCVNGQVTIGSNSFIGSNSVVGNNIQIADHTVISAGSHVLKNINDSGTYIGNPIRKIK